MRTCCVCGHDLDYHTYDKIHDWFRCHGIGSDGYQCECRMIRKLDIDYELETRIEQHRKEFEKGTG